MARYLYIETYGCQMNKYDSELLAGILAEAGYELTANPGHAAAPAAEPFRSARFIFDGMIQNPDAKSSNQTKLTRGFVR